jgi:hypothetical protein
MKLLVTFILTAFCLSLSAQKEKAVSSNWRGDSFGELKLADTEYASAKKGAVLYYISNDDRNIFIDMKIKETVEQNHILQLGMTVWVNMDGKARKEMGIRFPIGSQFMRRGGRGGGNMNDIINPPSPLSQANTIELVGFKGVEATRFPADNTDNFRGSIKYDKDGNLIYSLTIPLEKLPLRNTAAPNGQLPFTIGIEYGAPPVTTGMPGGGPSGMPSSNMRGSTGPGKGSRGGSGGGMPMGGARPGSDQTPVNPVVIWVKEITLAQKK